MIYRALILLTLLSMNCHADPICQATIDASSANISSSWVQSATLRNLRNVQSVFAVNTASTEILINCSGGGTAPVNGSKNNIPVGGGSKDTTWALDNVNGGSSCWYKANGSTISSGIFKLCVSGN